MLPSWVSYWSYQQILDNTEKCLLVMNTLGYFASPSATKEKSFMTLTPGVNVLKLFFVVIDEEENKLGRLFPASHSSLV
jgi:hypothetical protein